MSRRARRRHGYTLLELMVGGAVALIIASLALGWVLTLDATHQRKVKAVELRRISSTAFNQLVAELKQAGLGVPDGIRGEGAADTFPARIVAADATEITFLADLPRPDGTLNGISDLVDDQLTGAPAAGVALLNELNGGCDVGLGANAICDTAYSSRLFAADAGIGCHVDPGSLSCPWALNRYQPGEYVLVVDGSGRWVERQVGNPVNTDSPTRRMLAISAPLPAPVRANARGGYVSTPDRVFYRLDAGYLERDQCWGTVGGVVSLATLASACGAASGTDWERVAAFPAGSTLTFTYYDAAGTVLVTPLAAVDLPKVRRVDVALHLQRKVGVSTVAWDTSAIVSFRQP